ncbi:MAG: hypothetical protein WBQ86_18105 [Candidatus Binatus sp.]
MKLQAHIPAVNLGTRDWRAAMIALVSLFAASVLLTLRSGVLPNNSLLDLLRTPPIARPHISFSHRVSLDLHSGSPVVSPSRRFSVAHPQPANVASSQPYSIGIGARAAFEVFGEAALRNMPADPGTTSQLKPRNDRMMLMLMLLRLHTHRS